MVANKPHVSISTSLLLFFAIVLAGPLLAQDADSDRETMENSDFSDGSTHWHGDCKPAGSDMTTDFTSASSADVKGIVVDLHSSTWTKVTQEIFKYKGDVARGAVLTIVYQTSPDFKLSSRPSDYGNVGPLVGFGGATVGARPGQIMALIDMPPPSRSSQSTSGDMTTVLIYPDIVAVASFVPSTDAKPQTFTAPLGTPQPTGDDKPTFCLAFPPGSGSITITKISLVPGSGSNRPGFAP